MLRFLYDILPFPFFIILVGVVSGMITYLVIPKIISIVNSKNLMDIPNQRSSHTKLVPTMGGIAFFASLIFSLFLLQLHDRSLIGINIAIGLVILFYIGIKDDLMGVSPKIKIMGQIATSVFIMESSDFCINSFGGFLGIYQIPIWASYFLGMFLIVIIINSYNLIDGINGLASMVGVVIFSIFGFIFYKIGDYYFSLLCVVSISCLIAFLRYNISPQGHKNIFMGDTGSMIIGFVIGICSLRFLSLSDAQLLYINIKSENKFIITIAILFVLFVDTLRVFVIRMVKNGKPFFADRNHMHHVIIDYIKISHAKASFLLAMLNMLAFIVLYHTAKYISTGILFLFLVLLVVIISLLLFYFNKSYPVKKQKYKIRKILNTKK